MKLGTQYDVLIKLHMRSHIEEFFGKSIQEIFPVGRVLEITALDRVVARGFVVGILERTDE